jgi:hypothetical protein
MILNLLFLIILYCITLSEQRPGPGVLSRWSLVIFHKVSLKINTYDLRPSFPRHVSPGGFEPVEVEVLIQDQEKARQLIAELNRSK